MSLQGQVTCGCPPSRRWRRGTCPHGDGLLAYERMTQWGWEMLQQLLAEHGTRFLALRALVERTNEPATSTPTEADAALREIPDVRRLDLGHACYAVSEQGFAVAASGALAHGQVDRWLVKEGDDFEALAETFDTVDGETLAPSLIGLLPVLMLGGGTGDVLLVEDGELVLRRARSYEHPLWDPNPPTLIAAEELGPRFTEVAFRGKRVRVVLVGRTDPPGLVTLLHDQDDNSVTDTELRPSRYLHSLARTPPGDPSLGLLSVRRLPRAGIDFEYILPRLENLCRTSVEADRFIEWW